MRRHLATLGLTAVCLTLFAPRAEANWWHWLDDLSGPKFKGWKIQYRLYCFSETTENQRLKIINGLVDQVNQQRRTAVGSQMNLLQNASLALETAMTQATAADEKGALSKEIFNAFNASSDSWRELGLRLSDAAASKMEAEPPDATAQRQEAETRRNDAESTARLYNFAGPPFIPAVSVSACKSAPNKKRTGSIDINIAWGRDKKPENSEQGNTLVMLGPSFTFATVRSLNAGVGAGVAWFSSRTNPSFERVYLEPIRVEWRPALAFMKHPNAWLQIGALRYQALLFPNGFPPGSFGSSPRYPAEVVHQWDLVLDLEPVFDKFRP
jgi:hypothetical protein